MTIAEILARLGALEERLIRGVRDNMRIEGIHLKLFKDGSGIVDAEWSKYRKDMCREEALLHSIFSEDSPLFTFEKFEQLGEWLEGMTPEFVWEEK